VLRFTHGVCFAIRHAKHAVGAISLKTELCSAGKPQWFVSWYSKDITGAFNYDKELLRKIHP